MATAHLGSDIPSIRAAGRGRGYRRGRVGSGAKIYRQHLLAPKVKGGAVVEVKNSTRASSILLGGGKLRPFIMAMKSARADEKVVAGESHCCELDPLRQTPADGCKALPGKLRDTSQRGLVDFSLPIEEEKLP